MPVQTPWMKHAPNTYTQTRVHVARSHPSHVRRHTHTPGTLGCRAPCCAKSGVEVFLDYDGPERALATLRAGQGGTGLSGGGSRDRGRWGPHLAQEACHSQAGKCARAPPRPVRRACGPGPSLDLLGPLAPQEAARPGAVHGSRPDAQHRPHTPAQRLPKFIVESKELNKDSENKYLQRGSRLRR